jgi:hypothetical protein
LRNNGFIYFSITGRDLIIRIITSPYFCGERGITFGDRPGITLQTFNEPFRFYFFYIQFLQKANFLRSFCKINNPAAGGIHLSFAERGGFEPPVRRKANNGFRDRRIRPLCHLSFGMTKIINICLLAAFSRYYVKSGS